MILAVDGHYVGDLGAIAGVAFSDWKADSAEHEYAFEMKGVQDYTSGEFYRRELPLITALLAVIPYEPTTIIIDGFVDLGENPGMGRRLFHYLDGKVKVIGVAKNPHPDATSIKVFRHKSLNPLYITAAGIPQREAADLIRGMHGKHRLPTLIKRADILARSLAKLTAPVHHLDPSEPSVG